MRKSPEAMRPCNRSIGDLRKREVGILSDIQMDIYCRHYFFYLGWAWVFLYCYLLFVSFIARVYTSQQEDFFSVAVFISLCRSAHYLCTICIYLYLIIVLYILIAVIFWANYHVQSVLIPLQYCKKYIRLCAGANCIILTHLYSNKIYSSCAFTKHVAYPIPLSMCQRSRDVHYPKRTLPYQACS